MEQHWFHFLNLFNITLRCFLHSADQLKRDWLTSQNRTQKPLTASFLKSKLTITWSDVCCQPATTPELTTLQRTEMCTISALRFIFFWLRLQLIVTFSFFRCCLFPLHSHYLIYYYNLAHEAYDKWQPKSANCIVSSFKLRTNYIYIKQNFQLQM